MSKWKTSEVILLDGTKLKYEWKHHKKKNAIEVLVENKGKVSHILINAGLKEITYFGEIDWSVAKITTNKNGFRFDKLRTEDEFAKKIADRL
jgi:hypothetical protein